MSAVVEGNSSAVPIGTSGMTSTSSPIEERQRIQQQPDDKQHGTGAHGPGLADPVDNGPEQDDRITTDSPPM